MENYTSSWTKDEFIAYLLLYVAQSDFEESPEEQELIVSKVGKEKFEKIHQELDEDNDYQSLQKIMSHVKAFNYSKCELDELMTEIKTLFLSDGEYNTLEKNMLIGMHKILC